MKGDLQQVVVFHMPDVGEGLVEAEVAEWQVAVGDLVEVNDPIVEIETAKSLVELPSPQKGEVVQLHAAAGEVVAVGAPLISFRPVGGELDAVRPHSPSAPVIEEREVADRVDEVPLVLVGTGPRAAVARRYSIKNRPTELGKTVHEVDAPQRPILETRIPVRGVRRATARAMVGSVRAAPHASVGLSVDVTKSIELVASLRQDKAWADVRVTPLLFVCRALVLAIRAFPEINSTWDDPAQEIVIKHEVNLGIAVAGPRGLLVPNIKNAEKLDLRGLGEGIIAQIATARAGKSSTADMSGGTVTVTNAGVFGVEDAQPILNPGEAAILAMGSINRRPWAFDDGIALRDVMKLTLTFDHRIIDGQQASLCLRRIADVLRDPGNTLLYA